MASKAVKKALGIKTPAANDPITVLKLQAALIKEKALKEAQDKQDGKPLRAGDPGALQTSIKAGNKGNIKGTPVPIVNKSLTAVGDILSRVQYASANTAQNFVNAGQQANSPIEFVKKTVTGTPGAIVRGITGKEKGSYVNVLRSANIPKGPRIPGTNISLRDASGEFLNVVADPSTYTGLNIAKEATAAAKAKVLTEHLADATAKHVAIGVPAKALVGRGAKGRLSSLKPLYDAAEQTGKAAVDALPKGKVEVRLASKHVASSEPLYKAGKFVKTKFNNSELGQAIRHGFDTNAIESAGKIVDSQGANEAARLEMLYLYEKQNLVKQSLKLHS